MKQLWLTSVAIASLAGCGSSKTVEQINSFADKVCACQDTACATSVETEYLDWWGKNQRARGSEGDRKGVEKALQRYSKCYENLAGPKLTPEPVKVPQVDLTPAPAPAPAPAGLFKEKPKESMQPKAETNPGIAPELKKSAAPEAAEKAPPTP